MSVNNFYQTLYQTETLFRVAGEPWDVLNQSTVEPSLSMPPLTIVSDIPNLLTELAELAAGVPAIQIDLLLTEIEPAVPIVLIPEPVIPVIFVPEPVSLTAIPEPLPQPAPRPTMPSILPPVQQRVRMPQLNHKVLLLADEELDPSNLLFLEKVLKAVNLNVDGVDLLNLHGAQEINFAELLRGKYINHFITFGVPFDRINLDIMMDRYSPVRFEGITFLMADSLPTIEADQNLKKRLWSALQRVFQL